MGGPLEGIRVVEMGIWLAAPAAAAILRDWGAEVIKIEPPNGDPYRGLVPSAAGISPPVHPAFELDNRGKRSVALNLEHEDGRAIARQLVERADVFVTNMRPRALEVLGFDYDTLSRANPRLVYAQVTGYGPDGPNRDRAAYDHGAFWARGGLAGTLKLEGRPPPLQPGGVGDHVTGLGLAGAVCCALVARERTGEGQRVDISLIRAGVYTVGTDAALALRFGAPIPTTERGVALNPLLNCYQDSDGRWFWLLLLQADRHWPDVVRALGREELLQDERFANIESRREHRPELVAELDQTIATKTLEEWGKIFDRENVWWAPMQTLNEVMTDPVAHEAGVFREVAGPEGPVPFIATPADFGGTPAGPQGLAPELGQHTEEVLLELGYGWDQIVPLKERGAIP